MIYLGLDIGTSGVKVVLVDEHQNIVDQATAPLTVNRPKQLWSEQNPQDWWEATTAAVKQLDASKRSGVKAIGLSGQMHGATCLGKSDKVIRPAILWNDGRSGAECLGIMAGNAGTDPYHWQSRHARLYSSETRMDSHL